MIMTLRFVWRTFALLAATFVYFVLFRVASFFAGKRRRRRVINWWVPRWASTCLRIFNIELLCSGPHVSEGKLFPGKGANGIGRVFIANHRSTVDIPLLLSLIEAHAISRHDLAEWPIIGRGARAVGTLFVDRKSRRSGASVLREVSRALERGEGVAMFPEGTTHPGDEVHEFHNGAFSTARRNDAELIPIGIAYEDEAALYHHEKVIAHVKRLASLQRVRVAVVVGEPLVASAESTNEFKEMGRRRVQELVHQARKLVFDK